MTVSKSWQLVALLLYFSYLFFPLFIFAFIHRGVWWLLPAALVMIVVPVLDSLAGADLTPDDLVFIGLTKMAFGSRSGSVRIGEHGGYRSQRTRFRRSHAERKAIRSGVGRYDRQHRYNGCARVST